MIFIQGNVPSLKNSKNPFLINGRIVLTPSKTVKKYLKNIGIREYSGSKKTVLEYSDTKRPNLFKQSVSGYFDNVEYPCILGFHFVRGTRHRFDFINAVQIISDLLVAHDFIEDDDMDHFIPEKLMLFNFNYYSYSKELPGVYIKILNQ